VRLLQAQSPVFSRLGHRFNWGGWMLKARQANAERAPIGVVTALARSARQVPQATDSTLNMVELEVVLDRIPLSRRALATPGGESAERGVAQAVPTCSPRNKRRHQADEAASATARSGPVAVALRTRDREFLKQDKFTVVAAAPDARA